MTEGYVIYKAYSRNKFGFRAFSYELYNGKFKSGWHTRSADTLEEAYAALDEEIRYDWGRVNKPVPPVIDCGKVADIDGRTHMFKPKK